MGFEYTSRKHLPDLFDAGPVHRAMRRLAEDVGDRMLEVTVENTPIGGRDVSGEGGGNLRSSWHTKPVVRMLVAGDEVLVGGVETEVDYAPHVEFGTGLFGPEGRKYLIEAKPGKWLSWITRKTLTFRDGTVIPAGQRVFFKRVLHPGSPGQHMVAIACNVVEHELDRLAQRALAQFVREVERQ